MKDLGHAKGYKYPHNYKGAVVEEDYRPREIKDRNYYRPSERGYEKEIKERLSKNNK